MAIFVFYIRRIMLRMPYSKFPLALDWEDKINEETCFVRKTEGEFESGSRICVLRILLSFLGGIKHKVFFSGCLLGSLNENVQLISGLKDLISLL